MFLLLWEFLSVFKDLCHKYPFVDIQSFCLRIFYVPYLLYILWIFHDSKVIQPYNVKYFRLVISSIYFISDFCIYFICYMYITIKIYDILHVYIYSRVISCIYSIFQSYDIPCKYTFSTVKPLVRYNIVSIATSNTHSAAIDCK